MADRSQVSLRIVDHFISPETRLRFNIQRSTITSAIGGIDPRHLLPLDRSLEKSGDQSQRQLCPSLPGVQFERAYHFGAIAHVPKSPILDKARRQIRERRRKARLLHLNVMFGVPNSDFLNVPRTIGVDYPNSRADDFRRAHFKCCLLDPRYRPVAAKLWPI